MHSYIPKGYLFCPTQLCFQLWTPRYLSNIELNVKLSWCSFLGATCAPPNSFYKISYLQNLCGPYGTGSSPWHPCHCCQHLHHRASLEWFSCYNTAHWFMSLNTFLQWGSQRGRSWVIFHDSIHVLPVRCHYYDEEDNLGCTLGDWHPLSAEKLASLNLNVGTEMEVFKEGFITIPGFSSCDQ